MEIKNLTQTEQSFDAVALYSQFWLYGDFLNLKFYFDSAQVSQEIEQYQNNFDAYLGFSEISKYFENGTIKFDLYKFKAGQHFTQFEEPKAISQPPKVFKVFIPLANAGENSLIFLRNNKLMNYAPGRCYLYDFLKPHAIFSFTENVVFLILSVELNPENVTKAIKALNVR